MGTWRITPNGAWAEEVGFEPTTRFSLSMEVLGRLICAQMCWVMSMEIMFFLMVSNVFAVSFAVKLEIARDGL